MDDSYTPQMFLTISRTGKSIDWDATGQKVADWVWKHNPQLGAAAAESADIIESLRAMVKKYGVKTVIAALELNKVKVSGG